VTYVPTLVPKHVAAVEPAGLAAAVDEAPHGHRAPAGLQVVHRWLVLWRRTGGETTGWKKALVMVRVMVTVAVTVAESDARSS